MLPENKIYNWYKNLNINIKLTFLSTIIIGLICHAYMMTNKWVNLDDIVQLIDKMDRTTSGRWFLQYPSAIGSDFSLPWVNGLLTITYSAVMAVFIVKMFNIKSKVNSILIGGILITFPTIGSLMPFMNTQDSYQFGAMLAGIGAYLLVKKKWGFIFTAILLTLSLAIYQTYLGYAAGLILIYIIKELLKDKDNLREQIILFIKTGIAFVVAVGLYLFVSRVIFGHLLTDYKGLQTMGSVPLSKLPELVVNTYVQMFKFFSGQEFNYHFPYMKYLFLFSTLLTLYVLYFIIKKRELDMGKIAAIVFILIVFPIAINIMYIMSWEAGVMLRMAYPYTVCFIFPLILIDFLSKNEYDILEKETSLNKKGLVYYSSWVLTITSIFAVYNNIYVTNKTYFKVGITNQSSHAYGNRIMTRLEMTPGYNTKDKVVFVGNPDSRTSFTKEYDTDDIKPFVIANHLTRLYSFKYYPVRFLGFPNVIHDYETYSEVPKKDLEEVKNLGIYPSSDSIKKINGVIYVKFKEIKDN